jgi:hypothetical protein
MNEAIGQNKDLHNDEDDEVIGKLFKYIFDPCNLENLPKEYHKKVASKLFEIGEGSVVADNLEKFRGLDHKEIASKLIEVGEDITTIWRLEKFQGLDKEIALQLIEAGSGYDVVKNLEKFQGLELNQEIASKLIEAGAGNVVADNLEKFQGLEPNQEIVLRLFEAGSGFWVAKNLEKFQGLDHKEIALKLIEAKESYAVRDHLKNFQGLDQEIAIKLIEAGEGDVVAENLEKFQGLDHREIVLKLIEAKRSYAVTHNLKNFQGLDHKEIASKFFELGWRRDVVVNLEKFQGLDHKEIALKLIEAKEGEFLINKLEKFKGLDQEIVLKLIEEGRGYDVANNLEKFQELQGLDKEVALQLIEAGGGYAVANNLEKFQGLGHKEIALKLFEMELGEVVENNLGKFHGLDQEIASKLIETGWGSVVVINRERFQGLELNQEIASKLFKAGQGSVVADGLEKFQGLNQEIAFKLVKGGGGSSVASNLENFPGLNHKELALKLIEVRRGHSVIENIEAFQALDQEIALGLIEAGEGRNVAMELREFQELDQREVALKIIESGSEAAFNVYYKNFEGINFDKIKDLNILHSEYVILEDDLIDCKSLKEIDNKQLFEKLKKSSKVWQQEEIGDSFESAGEYFSDSKKEENIGYRKMFEYVGSEDRHDVLHNFPRVIEAAKESGLKPAQFYENILMQVKNDNQIQINEYINYEEYGDDVEEEELRSRDVFDNIMSGLDIKKWKEIIQNELEDFEERLKNNEEIEEDIYRQTKEYSDTKNIFAGWKDLQNCHELIQYFSNDEFRESVKQLSPKGREYAQKLIAHPNIDSQKVVEFCSDPESFMGIKEIHATEAHELKKPSNYIEIPHLDLTAENLRDALIEGDMDKLQDWEALEIDYTLPENMQEGPKTLRYHIVKSLGVRSPEIKEAVGLNPDEELKSNGKLFSILNKRFKAEGLDLTKYLKGETEIPERLEEELEQFRGAEEIASIEYRAKINLKSDPDGAIAGNDTACCMPFGSGKNNVYTYNPVCALFTIQKKSGGNWRTVTQSVLTKDIDINNNVEEIVEQIGDSNIKLDEIVDEELLINAKKIIVADNIEVAPNFKNNKNKDEILKYIYQDFFKEYVDRYGEEEELEDAKIIIGKGYTDALNNLQNIENTFVPIAPVGYSDNIGAEAMKLELDQTKKNIALKKEVLEHKRAERSDLKENKIKGIENLTLKDSLQVSYIEGKAYHDNESLVEYLHNMENALIAKDINNIIKNRTNLSLKYIDSKKKMQGYILAYEGTNGSDNDSERVIYVTDLAATPGSRLAGGRLLKGFIEKYKTEYIDKGDFVPILAEAREQTSYKIIKANLDKMSKELNMKFEIEELSENERGGDVMHTVVIRPVM